MRKKKIKKNFNDDDTDESDDDYENECSLLKNTGFNIKESLKTTFQLTIPYEKYLQFQPTYVDYKDKNGVITYCVLKQNAWSDIINDNFIIKYELPCNFSYKHCKVSIDSSRSQYFLLFDATCKDCNNSLRGWSEYEPKVGCSLELKILTYDTRGQELEHNTKRHLKGLKRKIVGSQIKTDLASNWRRNQASELKFNRVSPHNLYCSDVL